MKRGLTMIEVLVAHSLLGAVALVAVSWLQGAAGTSAVVAPRLRWMSAADAVVQLIQEDLLCGDFDPGAPRVVVDNDQLRIETRGRGPDALGAVSHTYRRGASDGTLELRVRPAIGRNRTHLLLDGLSGWECDLDKETGLLRVSMISKDKMLIEREFEVQ